MRKANVIRVLGPSIGDVARACGVSSSAVSQWPTELPARIQRTVLAALARRHVPPDVMRSLVELNDPLGGDVVTLPESGTQLLCDPHQLPTTPVGI